MLDVCSVRMFCDLWVVLDRLSIMYELEVLES